MEGLARRRAVLGAALALPALSVARGQTAVESAARTTQRVNFGTVGVIAGGVDGTYIRIAADLAAVLDDGDRLRVLPMIGRGSLQNLSDLIFLRNVDVAIVQADALAFARRRRVIPGVATQVQYLAKLYDEEVHLLASRAVARVEDLAGKAVNVDVQGSGTAMTASLIFEALGIAPRLTNDPQDVALAKLRQGEIAASVFVAGKPTRLFAALPADSGLHFLPLPVTPALVETYLPSRLTPEDYPAIVPAGTTVDTLAVGAVLAVYAWQPGTDRYRRLAAFAEAFHEKFDDLLRPPRHPKWREVNLQAGVPGWTRFDPRPASPARTPVRPGAPP